MNTRCSVCREVVEIPDDTRVDVYRNGDTICRMTAPDGTRVHECWFASDDVWRQITEEQG